MAQSSRILLTFVDDTKPFKDIAERRSIFYADLDRALDIVRDFIIKKNLIIYGGMAIDLSLKAAGHKGIYADTTIPDYDFMSPDFYNDSNELGDILADAGFDNVSVINAVHVTTRRVRVNFISVADITYIPPVIYDKLPTLVDHTSTIRVIHPDFQRLDMHRAFSTPFEKPPLEVYLGRAAKDQKRFALLAEAYPLSEHRDRTKAESGHETTNIKIPIRHHADKGPVIGGLMAAMLYIGGAVIKDDHICADKWPKWASITLITDDFEALMADEKANTAGTAAFYNKYLDDYRPRTVRLPTKNGQPTLEIFDNCGRLLPVAEHNGVLIAQAQSVLLYLLLASFEDIEHKSEWRIYYNELVELITNAEANPESAMAGLLLTTNIYGSYNVSPDYLSATADRLAIVNSTERPAMRPPFGYYPPSVKQPAPFDPSTSELFAIDGQKRTNSFESLRQLFPFI